MGYFCNLGQLSTQTSLGQTAQPTTPTSLSSILSVDTLSPILNSSGNTITIRSQVTPDITIDLNQLLKGATKGESPKTAVEGTNSVVFSFIKPEIELNILGMKHNIAPYGEPSENFSLVIVVGAAALVAIGAASAFAICKQKRQKPSKTKKKRKKA